MEGSIIFKNKCSVPGCDDKVSKRHRFPKEEQLLKKWIENVNAPLFSSMEPSEIYKKYVCDRHFSSDFKVPGTRRGLRKDAFPNICLSAVVLQGKKKDDVHLTSKVEEAASVTSDFIRSPVIPNVEDETCLSPPQNNSCTKPLMKCTHKEDFFTEFTEKTMAHFAQCRWAYASGVTASGIKLARNLKYIL
ncbi:uncharacterized protein LOC135128445 [Zophobas morio]|uniref:uncharacterized protein LOC135128445 n=1 Tax=Zophobas morio TaxID=2755281 RepID=UPI0030831FAF